MNRYVKYILLLGAMLLMLLLASCTETIVTTTAANTTAPSTTEPATTAPVTTAPVTAPPSTTTAEKPLYLTVIDDGASEFTIVQPYRSSFAGLSDIVTAIRKIGTSIQIKNDKTAATEHEILIGDTSRPETLEVISRLSETASDAHFQYVIAEVNGKLILYGDCDVAYTYVLERFLALYVDGKSVEGRWREPRCSRRRSWRDTQRPAPCPHCGRHTLWIT